MSLARQLLLLQLGIVLLVLVGVAAVSVANLDARNGEAEARRAQSTAEYVAGGSGVRGHFEQPDNPVYADQAQGAVRSAQSVTGAAVVLIVNPDGRVVFSSDPALERTDPGVARTDAFEGRSWVGVDEPTGRAMAMVPVIVDVQTGAPAAVVVVQRERPSALDNLGEAMPNLLTYLGIASVLGVLGSLLLARRVRRQTLGMEPIEIKGLVEHREALLSGIKEGVVAVDLDQRITLVNEQAAHLLSIPMTSTGTHLASADDSGVLASVFDEAAPATDRVLPVGRSLVTVSRMPVHSHGRHIGWVATLRDRTELLHLQRELDLNTSTTDVLRAQAHEFSNRLHVVNGLIALGDYDDARAYIREISEARTLFSTAVTDRVADPAVAALLVAKASQAGERGVEFVVSPASRLDKLDPGLSSDVNTVVGNLVDNAFDAAVAASAAGSVGRQAGSAASKARVEVELVGSDGAVVVTVHDSGHGVNESAMAEIFTAGVSTKAPDGHHGRGMGLALVRVVCRGRGGDVRVYNDDGAVFVATLPMSVGVMS